MKKYLIHLLIFSLFAVCPSKITAQIIIGGTNFSDFFAEGNVITERFDTTSQTYDIGMPGAGNNWDFSAENLGTASQLVVDPASTPAASNFQDANISIVLDFEEQGVTGSLYNYLSLDDSGLNFLGSYSASDQQNQDFEQLITNTPPRLELPIPLSYEAIWSYEGLQAISTNFDGGNFTQENILEFDGEVDAYGNITLPDGGTSEALRIKETRRSTSEPVPGFPIVVESVSFVFMTEDGDVLTIAADAASPSDQGMIQGTLSWTSPDLSSAAQKLLDEGFHLSNISPNPVKESAQIWYDLPSAENIQVFLFDINGRPVKKLVQAKQAAGRHTLIIPTSDLPAGQYIISLTAKNGVLSRKLLVKH
ncbi:MAG TPA: T9SS type A sorting domain-containing protein [Saprospiraceae bacterium]|nr:T9SS type A sorting domain-containing protein [Saprospiraceae bacterium]